MIHKWKGRKLQRTTAHRQALARNIVTSLFTYGRIVTTLQKAKEFRGLADRLITWARRAAAGGDREVHHYRRILQFVRDRRIAYKLVNDIAKRYDPKVQGGYTRVLRTGGSRWDGEGRGHYAMNRLGDNGQKAIWELTQRKEAEEELYLAGRGKRARDEREQKRLEKKTGKKAGK
jgi:large subunit ribosomal protein L17